MVMGLRVPISGPSQSPWRFGSGHRVYPDPWEDLKVDPPNMLPCTAIGSFLGVLKRVHSLAPPGVWVWGVGVMALP